MDETPCVRVATVATAFEAKVMAARLGADGVLCQLRGAADSIYPVGTIDVLVEPQRVDLARALLSAETAAGFDDLGDIDAFGGIAGVSGLAGVSGRGAADERWGHPRRARRWAAVGVVVLVVLFVAVRMFSLG